MGEINRGGWHKARPSCVCLTVLRRQESSNNGMPINREFWECPNCRTEFHRHAEIARLNERVREQKAEMDRIARALYPHKETGFTYSIEFMVDELARKLKQIASLTEQLVEAKKKIQELEYALATADYALQEARKAFVDLSKFHGWDQNSYTKAHNKAIDALFIALIPPTVEAGKEKV